MMAVNQDFNRPAPFQNPIMNFNMAVGGYLVPPSPPPPPPPQAFMINEPEDGVVPEENMQALVHALDNVALNQVGVTRDPNEEAMESTRRI